METNKEKKNGKKILIVVAVVIALLAAVYFAFGPKGQAGSKHITVTVDHLNAEDTSFEYDTDEEFLRGVLEGEGLISGSESEYGLFVETVDGETADDSQQQWWGFTVNGEFAQNGVDTQPVTDGDEYVFTLNEGYDSFEQ